MAEEEKETSETIIDKAEKSAERLEAANKKAEELLARNQAVATRMAMGGKSEAGKAPEVKKEISNREYAEAALRGKILK